MAEKKKGSVTQPGLNSSLEEEQKTDAEKLQEPLSRTSSDGPGSTTQPG